MKIHQLIIGSVIVFLSIVGVLSGLFYKYEREAVLGYMTSGIEQSVFRKVCAINRD